MEIQHSLSDRLSAFRRCHSHLVDEQGFFYNPNQWSVDLARSLAKAVYDLALTPTHVCVLQFARQFYSTHEMLPPARLFVQCLKKEVGLSEASSLFLQTLFLQKPMGCIAQLAGLPKPVRCI